MNKIAKIIAVTALAAVTACALTACGGPKMTGYLLDGDRQLAEGETTTITVAGDYGDKVVEDSKKETITIEELTWKSSDEAVATVENGVVTAVASGDVTISATSADEKLTGSMDVKVVAVEKIDVTLDKEEITLKEKETDKVTATVEPERDDYTVAWKSSDEKVATVDDNGTVTAVSSGKAEVSITVSKDDVEKTATVDVTVEEEKKPAKEDKPSKNDNKQPAKEDKPAKNDKPSKPAKEDKPAPAQPNPPAPAPAPEQPAPVPVQPNPPAPAPAPEQPAPAPEPTLAPDEEPVVSLPDWGDDVNGVPFD